MEHLDWQGLRVLPKISMIADDLELAAGICGASSGMVPTTVGQPPSRSTRSLWEALMQPEAAREHVLGLAQQMDWQKSMYSFSAENH